MAASDKFNQRFKLTLLNELLRMLLEQNHRITARNYLEYALQMVDDLEYNPIIFDVLGELSEYCYQLNDIEDGRRLLKKYLSYIDDTYDKVDIDYAVAHALEFKYLESDGDWDKLTQRVIDASASLREQISNNFTGMTSAQREYFIDRFRPFFSYANRLMELHPDERLATACFENNMFLKGLLLRSDMSVANAIAAMGNKELTDKYNRFVDASRELTSRRYVSGPGNYFARKRLENEVAALESEIAGESMDFRRESDSSVLSISGLKKSLDENDVVLQIVEGEKSIFALLMEKGGTVMYEPIASKASMAQLMSRFGAVYVDRDAANEMFGKIIPHISGKDVYLSTTGMFNQIAFGALPVGKDSRVMSDLANIHLVGSPTDIPAVKTMENVNPRGRMAVLWGGIDYGAADSVQVPVSAERGILRGEALGKLTNSLDEVSGIAEILKGAGGKTTVISGDSATEKSFTSRNRRRDYILHISTHGFFHDSGAFTDPMRNSGLLFAGSQKYWMNENLVSSINDADGILRADEIAGLDLSGCRIVVLSACQTGLGEYNSEGVYGLQRAFKLAGAQSVLMSLWNVDDRATNELMTAFYKNLIAGKTPDEALTCAQLSMRRKGYSPDKWAAFILLN